MCRFVLYSGKPISLENLAIRPSNSILNQSLSSRHQRENTNGDGFGIAWYKPTWRAEPVAFRSVTPAWSNRNLLQLAPIIESPMILCHVRAATPGIGIADTNCHPFVHGPYAFMHNGHLSGFRKVRRTLVNRLSDAVYEGVEGTTDSEHIFALFLDHILAQKEQHGAPALGASLVAAMRSAMEMAEIVGVAEPHFLNMAVTDGKSAAVTRFTSGPADDAETLYVHKGGAYVCDGNVCHMVAGAGNDAVLVSSEELSDDPGWQEVPVNHLVLVHDDRRVDVLPLGF